ncbi:FAD-binding oxidoreductase [Pseudomonadota bacterium]|nr:FAD-binding oxidoreductase [Pseudomonadota bacterium]
MSSLSLRESLLLLLGHKGWVNAEDSTPWQKDWLNNYGESPLGVARPHSTDEVSQVIKLCNDYGAHIVPRGGNTGLVGGSILGTDNGIILSLDRMNKILQLDEASCTVSLESGVILDNLHQFLEVADLMFPMHLGSEGSAQIGGLIATNAGGSHAFRYGMMQDLVLGLEVVLSDGAIWNGMRAVQKDNAGYQLRKLFCGSEGTLGIITKAVLKLSPKPRQEFTALLAVRDASGLTELSKKLRAEAAEFLTAMEFFSDVGLDIVLNNISDLVYPMKTRASFYLLLEAGSGSTTVPLDKILTDIMQWGIDENIILDGALAQSDAQRLDFWRLREDQPEGQFRLGAQLKHDISVPPGSLAEFLTIAGEECQEILGGVRINAFGHLGDGNVHYNLSPCPGHQDFLGLESEFSFKLASLATGLGGSFAAEHGLGRKKIVLADALRDPVERKMMLRIKNSFDDTNQLNPGVLICS